MLLNLKIKIKKCIFVQERIKFLSSVPADNNKNQKNISGKWPFNNNLWHYCAIMGGMHSQLNRSLTI